MNVDGYFNLKKLDWWFDNRDRPVILDIGAYNGEDSKIYFDLLKNVKLYAFEADPTVCEIFKKDCHSYMENDNFQLIEKAVSNSDKYINWHSCVIDRELDEYPKEVPDYYGNSGPSGTSKKPTGHLQQYKHITFSEPAVIPSIKLDTWLDKMNIDIIDFIHCDVNGGEREFFEGAKETLNNNTKFLWIEELYDSGFWEDTKHLKMTE